MPASDVNTAYFPASAYVIVLLACVPRPSAYVVPRSLMAAPLMLALVCSVPQPVVAVVGVSFVSDVVEPVVVAAVVVADAVVDAADEPVALIARTR